MACDFLFEYVFKAHNESYIGINDTSDIDMSSVYS